MVNKENDLISVIVPIYNTEKFLRKCIDSIVNQTYKNLEIILVNDGSPDNSKKICKEYAEKDKRIVYIEQENGGLSRARNAGLDVAKGKYIGFVDSDDYIHEQMYEKLYRFMVTHDCQIVECQWRAENKIPSKYMKKSIKRGNWVINNKAAVENYLLHGRGEFCIIPAVWSKLFTATFWNGQRFPEGKVHEDYFLTCKALYEAQRVGIIGEALYYHIENPESITYQKFSARELYILEQYQNIERYLKEKKEWELSYLSRGDLVIIALYFYFKARKSKVDTWEIVKILDDNKNILSNPLVTVKYRIAYKLYSINRDMAFLLYKFLCLINKR